MKRTLEPRPPTGDEPARLGDTPDAETAALVRVAQAYEPPHAARERVWERIAEAHRPTRSELLEKARVAVEPPAGALERIWRRLVEEALVRAGLAEPARLSSLASDDVGPLVAQASELEPGFATDVRVRHRLGSRPETGARGFGWLRWTLVPVAAALAAVLVLTWPDSPVGVTPPAPVAEGVVPQARPATTPPELAPAEPRLMGGSRLALSPGHPTFVRGVGDVLLDGDGAGLEVVRDDDRGTLLHLTAGRVAVHADKRKATRPLVIEAAGVEVRVVGTVFGVEQRGAQVDVFVAEGVVAVRRTGLAPLFVRAGEHWASGPRVVDAAWMNASAKAVTEGSRLTLATQFARVDRTPPARPLPVADDETPVVAQAPVTAPAAVPTVVTPPPAAPVRPPLDLQALAAPYAGLDVRGVEESVLAARRAGDVRAEAGALWRLRTHPGATADQRRDALETLAVLADGALRSPEVAVGLRWDIARGSKASRANALFELAFSLHELGRDAEALQAADQCLADCGDAQRRLVRPLRARMLLSLGDVDGARQAFREMRRAEAGTAATSPESATAEVLFNRATYLQQQGQPERARVGATSALALDPNGLHAFEARALLGP